MMRSSMLALVCAACWSSPTVREPPAAPAKREPPRDAGVHAPPATPCPAAYGSTDPCTPAEPRSVVVRQRTDVGQGPGSAEDVASFESPRCTYAQGTCECLQGPRTCGGGAAVRPPPPGWQPPPFRWECTPAVRADGCPGVPPRAGDPCTIAHACGYCMALYHCDHGAWSIPTVGPPPP